MSSHADTIRAMLPTRGSRTSVWWSAAESEAAHASLDALLAENQRLREERDALLDDVLVLMDQHTSGEVKREARLRIIERHAEVKAVRG